RGDADWTRCGAGRYAGGMSTEPAVHGTCDPRFTRVRDAFVENFRTRDEIGAAVAITLDGEPVVDLWAGDADQARTQPWDYDTIVNVYSCTKGMTALCAHRLVEEGPLHLDPPGAEYWPQCAQAGKAELPVRWLLGHRAGLPAVRTLLPNEALYDWGAMTAALAAQEPWWRPGSAHGYHAVTFGWLVGEVVRRITGRSLGTYFRGEIAKPLGADFHIGLAEEHHGRVGAMGLGRMPMPGEGPQLGMVILSDPEGVSARAFMNPPSMAFGVNNVPWRTAEIPGANGHANARAMARIYGVLARGGDQDGVHLLDAKGI